MPSRIDIKARDHLRALTHAVDLTSAWRQRCAKDFGRSPPTAYHRILLFLYDAQRLGKTPVSEKHLAVMTGISDRSMQQIMKRMAYEGLVAVARIDGTQRFALSEHGTDMAVA